MTDAMTDRSAMIRVDQAPELVGRSHGDAAAEAPDLSRAVLQSAGPAPWGRPVKRPSANMYEVAKLADVSIATVSRVVHTDSRVKEKTRQKVLSAMLQLGYQPNSIAQSLATRTSNSVGVLVSELHGAFYGAMLSAIEETLRAAGKFVLVATGHDREDQEREGTGERGCHDPSALRRLDRCGHRRRGGLPRV